MKLADYGEALAYDIAFWSLGLDNPDYPPQQLGKLSLELSTKLRALAIMTLLVKGDSDFFFHNLIRSGRARETYLRRARQQGLLEDHHRSLGRFDPLLDLIAAGDLDGLRRIEALSPGEYRPGHEYEDDYLFAALLHALSRELLDEAALAALLVRFEASLDGQPKQRFEVCRALVARDQDQFLEGFQNLIERHAAAIEEDKARGVLDDAVTVAQRQVFIEGLAFLRLAERRGLSVDGEFSYCPSLARVRLRVPFPAD